MNWNKDDQRWRKMAKDERKGRKMGQVLREFVALNAKEPDRSRSFGGRAIMIIDHHNHHHHHAQSSRRRKGVVGGKNVAQLNHQ